MFIRNLQPEGNAIYLEVVTFQDNKACLTIELSKMNKHLLVKTEWIDKNRKPVEPTLSDLGELVDFLRANNFDMDVITNFK